MAYVFGEAAGRLVGNAKFRSDRPLFGQLVPEQCLYWIDCTWASRCRNITETRASRASTWPASRATSTTTPLRYGYFATSIEYTIKATNGKLLSGHRAARAKLTSEYWTWIVARLGAAVSRGDTTCHELRTELRIGMAGPPANTAAIKVTAGDIRLGAVPHSARRIRHGLSRAAA